MTEPHVQIDVNIRFVEAGEYRFDYAYGTPEQRESPSKPSSGRAIQVGSSVIGRGLSIPLGT